MPVVSAFPWGPKLFLSAPCRKLSTAPFCSYPFLALKAKLSPTSSFRLCHISRCSCTETTAFTGLKDEFSSMVNCTELLHGLQHGCMGRSTDCSALHGFAAWLHASQRVAWAAARLHGLQHSAWNGSEHGCMDCSTAAWSTALLHGSDHSTLHGTQHSCMDCSASYCNECFKVHHPWGTVKAQHEYVGPTTNIRLKVSTLDLREF